MSRGINEATFEEAQELYDLLDKLPGDRIGALYHWATVLSERDTAATPRRVIEFYGNYLSGIV